MKNNKKEIEKAINAHLNAKYEEAEELYKKIIKTDNLNLIAINNLASIYNLKKNFKKSITLLNHVLNIKPDYLDALKNLAIAQKGAELFGEAISNFQKILTFQKNDPNIYNNLGNCYREMRNFNLAIINYEIALKINPDFSKCIYNKGVCLQEIGLIKEAEILFKKSAKLAPNLIEPIFSIAHLQLLNENYKDGWKNYEFRKQKYKNNYPYINFNKELLLVKNFKDIKNKVVFISKEQGYGDYIQFSRYLIKIKQIGAKIILDTPRSLINIIKTLDIDFIHKDNLDKDDFDYHISILSLPYFFNTTKNNIPNKIPYLYVPKNEKLYWEKKIKINNKKKIGLMWTGNPKNENDKKRSLSLDQLKSILKLPFEFHSLQIDYKKTDEILFKEFSNLNCHKSEIIGFDKTAGLIDSLDLVISVDTSVAHLSGALGKNVWILLPYMPDFRWLLNTNKNQWYPTATIYRQSKIDDWSTVVKSIREDLLKL